ncbi:MAG: zinc ribbon domain-containing protein [Promethearchaeota archaeon]|jgi:rRNA maturation endonuclease Nob1
MTKEKNKKSKKSLAGKIKCPDCKEIIDEGIVFCPECGNRIPEFLRYNPDSSLSV